MRTVEMSGQDNDPTGNPPVWMDSFWLRFLAGLAGLERLVRVVIPRSKARVRLELAVNRGGASS